MSSLPVVRMNPSPNLFRNGTTGIVVHLRNPLSAFHFSVNIIV